MAEKEAADRDL